MKKVSDWNKRLLVLDSMTCPYQNLIGECKFEIVKRLEKPSKKDVERCGFGYNQPHGSGGRKFPKGCPLKNGRAIHGTNDVFISENTLLRKNKAEIVEILEKFFKYLMYFKDKKGVGIAEMMVMSKKATDSYMVRDYGYEISREAFKPIIGVNFEYLLKVEIGIKRLRHP